MYEFKMQKFWWKSLRVLPNRKGEEFLFLFWIYIRYIFLQFAETRQIKRTDCNNEYY